MTAEAIPGAVAMRIDVDFSAGLREAVPVFLDALARAGMRATFFVVAGRNDPRHSLRRLTRPGYLRRLLRLGPVGIARRLGPSFASGGGVLESEDARGVLERIAGEGHEIAVHGHDHAWWADHVWVSGEERLVEEIERAYDVMESVTGSGGHAWGSPSWRTTGSVLRYLWGRGVPYFSDCWGIRPFRTLDERGDLIPVPHLPITLPSLESLMLDRGMGARDAVSALLGSRRSGSLDVLCVHDYFEGLLRPGLFAALLDACSARGIRTRTLLETAREIDRCGVPLPSGRLTRGTVPGFLGEVSRQGE